MLKYKIYIDLDGVLADFDKKVLDAFGKTIPEFEKKVLWQKITQYDSTVEKFFETLELMDGAHRLIQFIKEQFDEYEFLTASGFTPHDVADQKRKWATKHFDGIKCNVVRKSENKAMFANPESILIDDRSKSIDPWTMAGGIGILHTSVDGTIRQLKELLK